MCQAPFWKLGREEQSFILWGGKKKPQGEAKWMTVENEESQEQEVTTLNCFGISLFCPPPKSSDL